MAGGLLGGISGAVVGALFGTGDAITTFSGWIVLGVVISGLIKVVCLVGLALPVFMVMVASGVGTIMAGLIVANLGHFYRHHSRTKFKFGVIQGAGLGGAIDLRSACAMLPRGAAKGDRGGFWNGILGYDISSNSECISKSN